MAGEISNKLIVECFCTLLPPAGVRMNGYSRVGRGMELGGYDVSDSRSSLMSSELESSSCFDSDDDGSTSR